MSEDDATPDTTEVADGSVITHGRGDLAERARKIMGMLKEASEDDPGRPRASDVQGETIYYATRSEVHKDHQGAVHVVWHAIALRGMHESVPAFTVTAKTERALERRLCNAYLDSLLNLGVPGDKARLRASTIKLEQVDREMVRMYARGAVFG